MVTVELLTGLYSMCDWGLHMNVSDLSCNLRFNPFKFMLQASMQPEMHLLRNVTIRLVDAYHNKLNGVESCTVGIQRACS